MTDTDVSRPLAAFDRRALQHAATVKRRAERVGRIADRLLALVENAVSDAPGRPPARTEFERQLDIREAGKAGQRRARALGILVGKDGAGEDGLKAWPATLIANSLSAAMQAARLSADLTEQALSLDVQRAAARAGAVARATVAGTIDGKIEGRNREAQAWGAAGAALPTTPTRGRASRPALFDESGDDGPPDPLAHHFTLDAEPPDDLPEPIVPDSAAHAAGGSLAAGVKEK